MSRNRLAEWTLALALSATMLAGCSRAESPTSTPAAAKPAEAPKPAAAAERQADMKASEPARPAAAAAAAPPTTAAAAAATRPPAAAAASGQTRSESATNAAQLDQSWDRMIIRNGTLTLQVANVESAIADARAIAGKYDGFVSASNTRIEKLKVGEKEEERPIAQMTLQVRAQGFDGALQDLRRIALKVEGEVGTSQDVTEEYVDLESAMRNLRTTEAAVTKLLEKAEKLDDVMRLTQELTNLRGQIERIEGRRRFLERRSDYSTIALNLQLPPPAVATPTPTPVPTATPVWDPGRSAERGWNASLRVLRGVADVAILAVSFGWWLVPFAAVAGIVGLRSRRRANARSAADA